MSSATRTALIVKYMNAEPEQLHAVLAIQSSRRILVPGGDSGNQAYLVRTSSCPRIAPRHGPPPAHPTVYYEIHYLSVHPRIARSRASACPEGNLSTPRTDPIPCSVSEASTTQKDGKEAMGWPSLMIVSAWVRVWASAPSARSAHRTPITAAGHRACAPVAPPTPRDSLRKDRKS